MIRLLIAACLLSVSTTLCAQVMWQVKTEGSQAWYLAQTDEFNDTKVNPDIWKPVSSPHPYHLALDLYYKADNIQYNQGYVSLLARRENTTAKVEPLPDEKAYLEKSGKTLNEKGEYTFAYSGALLTSYALNKPGFFEMRFKMSDQKGVWPSLSLSDEKESISLFSANGAAPDQAYSGVPCTNGCTPLSVLYSKKGVGGFTKLNESFSKDWNIVSAEWGTDYITYFINGTAVGCYKGVVTAGKELVVSHGVSKKGYGLKNGPTEKTQFPASFDVDYVRIWSKADTSGKYKDNYSFYTYSSSTIDNRLLYSGEVKKKDKAVSKAKELLGELGTITMLPVLYNKYSLSIQGNALSSMQVDVYDRFNEKVAGFALSNVQYYVMDLSALPTGPYKVKISVLGQLLEHDIPVIDPEKNGEYRNGK